MAVSPAFRDRKDRNVPEISGDGGRTVAIGMTEDPAGRRSYLRFFYRDRRPTRLGRIFNGAFAWASALGLTPRILLTLQVKGRSSGRLCSTVLVVASHQGHRYIASMLGNGSDWVQNVRAARGQAFIKRGR